MRLPRQTWDLDGRGPVAMPTFSVVMPAYNTRDTVGAAVRSVLAQTLPDFELVVVDDGSDDDTVAEIERLADPRVRVLRLDHCGAAAARNAGVAATTGAYVSLIDSDDLWLPGYLAAMNRALAERPDAGFAYTDAWRLDATTNRVSRRSAMHLQKPPHDPPRDPGEFLTLLLRNDNFIYTSVTIPRPVLDRVGPFDERLQASIDYEMWLRIVAWGYVGVRVPGNLCVYRQARPGSISSNLARVYSNRVKVLGGVESWPLVSTANRELARHAQLEAAHELDAVMGGRSFQARLRRLRSRLARAKRAALRDDGWLIDLPEELREAFPDLTVLGERP